MYGFYLTEVAPRRKDAVASVYFITSILGFQKKVQKKQVMEKTPALCNLRLPDLDRILYNTLVEIAT